MDSLKTKGGKTSGSIPIAIRFTAGEESVEDIIKITPPQTNDSLSSSPVHGTSDESNWRKDFLHGNFFGRKRSNSIEGNIGSASLLHQPNETILSSSSSSSSSTSTTTAAAAAAAAAAAGGGNAAAAVTSMGTWKIIKGKVTQAMEDIKSSKCDNLQHHQQHQQQQQQQQQHQQHNRPPQIVATAPAGDLIINSSNADKYFDTNSFDFENDEYSQSLKKIINLKKQSIFDNNNNNANNVNNDNDNNNNNNNKNTNKNTNNNNDIEFDANDNVVQKVTPASTTTKTKDMLMSKFSKNSSLLRRRKIDAGVPIPLSQQQQQQQQSSSKSIASTPSSASSSSSSSSAASTMSSSSKRRQFNKVIDKNIEIESGIEITEEMTLPINTNTNTNNNNDINRNENIDNIDFINNNKMTDNPGNKEDPYNIDSNNNKDHKKDHNNNDNNNNNNNNNNNDKNGDSIDNNNKILNSHGNRNIDKDNDKDNQSIIKNYNKFKKIIIFIVIIIIFLLILINFMTPFFQGVFSCLFTILICNQFYEYLYNLINKKLLSSTMVAPTTQQPMATDNDNKFYHNEKCPFKIPDYSKMPILEISSIEEHKQLKSYVGWMNEINSYDPANYHISMTKSVLIKLDGSTLRILNTSSRVPKRSVWNEKILENKNIIFTKHRTYNLLGSRIEMCPKGLARKRYFSRKYPLQLIIKNSKLENEDVYYCTAADEDDNSCDEDTNVMGNVRSGAKSSGAGSNLKKIFNDSFGGGSGSTDDQKRLENNLDIDFGTTIMTADLQKLHDINDNNETNSNSKNSNDLANYSSDEIRLFLFARCDREKEDWYRRFKSACVGAVSDQEFQFSDLVIISDDDIQAAIKHTNDNLTTTINDNEGSGGGGGGGDEDYCNTNNYNNKNNNNNSNDQNDSAAGGNNSLDDSNDSNKYDRQNSIFYGLLMSSCASRSPSDYIKFMSIYQKACRNKSIPVIVNNSPTKRNRREKKQEDELWKGINQSLYLGPSGSIVWANVLIGRVLFSCLNDLELLENIQEFLQKKLSSIKLPHFMEEVIIAQVNLGDIPPIIHRISQPFIDERGIWLDADITYEGLLHMTITTKLNLLRLKKQQHSTSTGTSSTGVPTTNTDKDTENNKDHTDHLTTDPFGAATSQQQQQQQHQIPSTSAIYDSNAESSGASSGSESDTQQNSDNVPESLFHNHHQQQQQQHHNQHQHQQHQQQHIGQGSSKKFLRIVDMITTSNLFQSATEISYIQKAMENMSTKIRLCVELKGLVGRIVINIPPPPSDRIWISFRGPPRLWITATPALGEHTFDWTIVTNAIERKLCEEVTKYLVYPNMVDVIVPLLGQSTYKE